jgi:hypothetical protein
VSNTGWPELIGTILRGVPALPGARCRQRPTLFEDPGRVDEAIAECQTCPALQACADWAATLRFNQIDGVIGAEHRIWVSHPSLARKVD